MDDDLETMLAAAEDDVAAAVADALTEVADEYATALDAATELVAARVSVSGIARMWARRVPAIVRRLLRVAEIAAHHAADNIDADLPDGWDDLPERRSDGRDLPPELGDYVTTTEHLLDAVGDRLAAVAVDELAAGVSAGEGIEQLRARLRAAFAREGAQLGEAREERIARTEATRAWNQATLAAAQALTGPDRPLVKQWITRGDSNVRATHRAVNGQLQLLDEPFTVAGVPMSAPGDPTAPPSLTANCRCVLAVARATNRSAAVGGPTGEEHTTVLPDPVTAAADGSHHQGAMIALMPSAADAARLAIDGGEHPDELHLTLYFLGEGADWDQEQRADLIAQLRRHANYLDPGPVHTRVFGAAQWNATSDTPCWVWSVGDDRDAPDDAPMLNQAHNIALDAVASMDRRPELPTQHSPWQPHVCAAYSSDPALLAEMNDRLGTVTFDRIRVAFAGDYTDIPLGSAPAPAGEQTADASAPAPRPWSTPGDTAIAFENTETGDGRIFAPGSLYWEGGPWPLQHADEMLTGHEGAELAGAIHAMTRDGDRLAATGVLYTDRPAGADAALLLEQAAPLGVSVDLDDVDVEFIDRRPADDSIDSDDVVVLAATLATASILRLNDGAWMVRATAAAEWTASGRALLHATTATGWTTAPDGTIPTSGIYAALTRAGITAAAGDPDDPDRGQLVHAESAGDVLMRITRGRVRGATLVAMPAYDRARIVLDDAPDQDTTASAASAPVGDVTQRIIDYVSTSPIPVGARETAEALGMSMESARGYLSRAAAAGQIVRLARGMYVGTSALPESGDLSAAVSGDTSLPVHEDRDAEWDGAAAASRVLEWATGDDGTVDAGRLGAAFLYRNPDGNPATLAAHKLGFADVVQADGGPRLEIIARGVYAAAGALQGARGGVDIPASEIDDILDRVEDLYERLADRYNDPTIRAPWDDDEEDDDEMRELEASAWQAMQQAPPMPAAWFREPTEEELPPGSGGVHYKDGRIYGWVAQAGEPHAGFPGKNLTIESIGRIDTTHFLRAKFALDDGSTVRAGAFTMNAPHNRDGAECETASCQFDDTRTVAGIVTVGMNSRGMWFSGAAGPWMSEWDRTVFQACQPSYHMKQGRDRRWQLRAVLSVPVPGHSSPLVASAAVERSNLALVASAAVAPPAVTAPTPDSAAPGDLAAALTQPAVVDALLDAMEQRQSERDATRAEIERLSAQLNPARQEVAASMAEQIMGRN